LAGAWSSERARKHQVELALGDGERQVAERHFADAVRSFERGVALTEGLPLDRELRRRMIDRLDAARRLELARQLHDVADEVRVLYAAESIPPERLVVIDAECRALWRRRDALGEVLNPAAGDTPTFDLRDIAVFASSLRVPLSAEFKHAEAHREALRILDEVEAAFGVSAVLEHERRIHRKSLGLEQAAAKGPAAQTAWEHYALGRALLASGDVPRASEELNAALRLDPGGRWTNFYAGQCAYRAGRFEDAVAAFSVCIGTAPDAAACYYNRALAYAGLGYREPARRDCDRALRLDPGNAQAGELRKTLVE
jgi:tetratricopeptide (TPR) repeat protein